MSRQEDAPSLPPGSSSVRVSVILIYYNAAPFIAEAIESVLAQTFPSYELLLVDDGSSDASNSIVEGYANANPRRIRRLQHPGGINRGMSATRNLGLGAAHGEYVAFIDADDRWHARKLGEQVGVLRRYPEVDAVFGTVNYWRNWAGEPDRLVRTGHVQDIPVPPPEALLKVYPLGRAAAPCPSDMMVRRSAALALGGFEESFTGPLQMYEDQAFFAKLYLDCTVYFDERNWLNYRIHDESCSATVARDGRYPAVRSHFLAWLEKYLERRPTPVPAEVHRALADARFRFRHPWIARAVELVLHRSS